MSRYLRFGFLVPRLVGLVVLLVLTEFGSGWALRWAIEDRGSQALGAKVEVGEATVSALKTRVVLEDIRAANPQQPMENLFEADIVELDFDSNALLRRKAIADLGVVSGLRFSTQRESSGALDPESNAGGDAPTWIPTGAADKVANAADQWLEDLERKLSAETDDFESLRLVEELRASWPNRYDEIADETHELAQEIEEFIRVANDARENPLRHAEFLKSAAIEANELRSRITALRQRLEVLPNELAADKQRLDAALQRDQQLIRDRLQVDQLDADSLTSKLLGEHVTGSIEQFLAWAQWVREMIPAGEDSATTVQRARGVDVRFADAKQRPDLLIRELRLSGTAPINGAEASLAGVVYDLTTQPALHGKPITAKLQTTDALPLTLLVTVDRTGSTPIDEVQVDCESLSIAAARLGEESRFALRCQQPPPR